MSTMLATQNPDEAARLEAEGNKPLADAAAAAAEIAQTGGLNEVAQVAPVSQEGMPEISDWILYQPRRGEIKRGRTRVPALVIWKHPDTRLLDLVLVYDANDVGDQQKVPEAVGEERGWLLKEPEIMPLASSDMSDVREIMEGVRRDVDKVMRVVLGDFDVPDTSILAMLDDVDARVDGLVADQAAKAIPVVKPPRAAKATKKKAKRGR